MKTMKNILKMTQGDLSLISGVGERTIKMRLKNLQPVEGPTESVTYYDTKQALYIIFQLHDVNKNKLDLSDQRAKLAKAQTERQHMEIAKMKKEVVPLVDVTRVVEKEYSYVRAKILAIPSKLAQKLSGMDDPGEINDALEKEISSTLTDMIYDETLRELEDDKARKKNPKMKPKETKVLVDENIEEEDGAPDFDNLL